MILSGSIVVSFANAQVIDGTRDGGYGAALALQTVNTQFGNGMPDGGSELDGGYAWISGGRLSVMLTGNLESNFNALEVFIDSVPGGENVLSGTPVYGGSTSAKFGGLTFDHGFTADYHLWARHGVSGTHRLLVDFANRMGGVSAMVPWSDSDPFNVAGNIGIGKIDAGDMAAGSSGSALTQDLFFGLNNNNIGGVISGTGAANGAAAAAVATGFEFSVALADIGNPGLGGTIRIATMINGSNHDFLSNQTLGGLPAGTGNLGGDGSGTFTGSLSGVDFNQFAGNQYFEVRVVPEPASFVALAVGALALLRRRRTRG